MKLVLIKITHTFMIPERLILEIRGLLKIRCLVASMAWCFIKRSTPVVVGATSRHLLIQGCIILVLI